MRRKTDNFNKFYNRKRNSAVKEGLRQEKKAEKKERKAAIERHYEDKRQARSQEFPADNKREKYSKSDRPGKGAPPAGASSSPAGAKGAAKGAVTRKNAPFKGGSPALGQGAHIPGQPQDLIPLNKYIAHGGVCSRRDAAELIRLGKVLVNGQPITEPGTKVSPSDEVKVSGKIVTISRNFIYILLNKPKDYITTTDDPQGRRTVLDLVRQATRERVFPVGRLDRNTSGVLLLTNDGDLSQKLAHPKHEIKKIYHVGLDKLLTKADFDKIINGDVILEDGPAHVDVLAYADPKDKTQIGIEIHSGRNRIVRRIFEHLGYDVRSLDRVMYAGLTKKNVQRGKWRLLNEKEIRILKYLNSSTTGKSSAQNAATEKEKRQIEKSMRTTTFELIDEDGLLDEFDIRRPTAGKSGSEKPVPAKSAGSKPVPSKPLPARSWAPKSFAPDEEDDSFDEGETHGASGKPVYRKKGPWDNKSSFKKRKEHSADASASGHAGAPSGHVGAPSGRTGSSRPEGAAAKRGGAGKKENSSFDKKAAKPYASRGPKGAGRGKGPSKDKQDPAEGYFAAERRSASEKRFAADKRSGPGERSFGDKRAAPAGKSSARAGKRPASADRSFGEKRPADKRAPSGDKRAAPGKPSASGKGRPSGKRPAPGKQGSAKGRRNTKG